MRQVLFLTVLVLSVLAVSCGGNAVAPSSNPASPTAGNGSSTLPTPLGTPSDVVKKASLEIFTSDTVRAKTVIKPADGSESTLTLEYVKPDRIHVVQSDGTERIALRGKGLFSKTGSTWQADGIDAADFLFALLDPQALAESFQVIQTDSIQYVGAELLDGKPVFMYTYKTVVDFGRQTARGDGKLWVGALDGRAYRGESTNDSLATPGTQDHTVVTYQYDIPITIEAPQ